MKIKREHIPKKTGSFVFGLAIFLPFLLLLPGFGMAQTADNSGLLGSSSGTTSSSLNSSPTSTNAGTSTANGMENYGSSSSSGMSSGTTIYFNYNALNSSSTGNSSSTSSSTVTIFDNYYSPSNLSIPAGTTVTWTNSGAASHTVTANDSSFDSGTLAPGTSYYHTFDAPGTYSYYCRIHGMGMSGTITVVASSSTSNSTSTSSSSTTGGAVNTSSTVSQNSSSTTNQSASTTVNGNGNIVNISNVSITETNNMATITWTTDIPVSSQVSYGPNSGNYTSMSNVNANPTTNHFVVINNLNPGTTYHFQILPGTTSGGNSASVGTISGQSSNSSTSDMTFTTLQNTTQINNQLILDEITQIRNILAVLEQQIRSATGFWSGGGTTTSTAPGAGWIWNSSTGWTNSQGIPWWNGQIPGNPVLEPMNPTVRAGTSVDIGGRNFGFRERVTVTSDGLTVATAMADDGGNFTTGSMLIGQMTGTKTFTFHGETSGITLSDTVNIIP